MFTTARIAAVLAFALICVPAQAMSLKDWLAKSKADQVQYLSNSLARLVVDVGKTDPQLAKKITSYYADKTPGAEYPPGMNDLFARIGRMVRQSETDKTVDLAKIEFEQVVVLNTAEKFKIQVPADFQRTGEPSAKPRPAAPSPTPAPNPAPRPTAPADDYDPIGPGGFITPPTVYKVSQFVPSWQGRTMIVEGTISRVVLDHASYVNIYFRESPDGSFTGYSPLPGLFLERYGRDFSALIGRTVQIEGEVQPFRGTKGSIRILDFKQMKVR